MESGKVYWNDLPAPYSMMEFPFTHLHLHSKYSIADAMINFSDLAKRLMELNMDTVAITDHDTMLNVVEGWSTLKRDNIKTIIGLETYVAPRSNRQKEAGLDNANYHLVLLCENNEGYQNLIKIASDAGINGLYYRHRTDKEHLMKYHQGIIALSACIAGEVQQHLLKFGYDRAKQTALEYDAIFGRGNFFLELQDHGLEEQTIINSGLRKLSKETGIPLVATNDCHYLHPEDYEAHDVLMAIQAKTSVTSDKRKKYGSDQFYVKSGKEMWDIFGKDEDTREALLNTCRIANRCNVTFKFGENKLPPFDVPSIYEKNGRTMDNETFFKTLIVNGMKKRYGDNVPQEYWDRCKYEFDVIKKMGYVNYFLIVWDIFRFCKTGTEEYGLKPDPNWRPILTGPGRGSGAGSLILYALGVTHIDPMEYDLLFERFLDPSRVSMPDCI